MKSRTDKVKNIIIAFTTMALLGSASFVAMANEIRYEFHDFNVPASMGSFTSAFGINNRGTIVGNFADEKLYAVGFVSIRGRFTEVVVPGSSTKEFADRGSLVDVNDSE